MTREQIRNDILGIQSNCILAELPTSVGKSRVALDFMKERDVKGRILIVIPRNVLIDNWKPKTKTESLFTPSIPLQQQLNSCLSLLKTYKKQRRL